MEDIAKYKRNFLRHDFERLPLRIYAGHESGTGGKEEGGHLDVIKQYTGKEDF